MVLERVVSQQEFEARFQGDSVWKVFPCLSSCLIFSRFRSNLEPSGMDRDPIDGCTSFRWRSVVREMRWEIVLLSLSLSDRTQLYATYLPGTTYFQDATRTDHFPGSNLEKL